MNLEKIFFGCVKLICVAFASVVCMFFMWGILNTMWSGYTNITDDSTTVKINTITVNSCDVDTVADRSAFILSCIDSANPKSDEEPEDWIDMCRTMSEKTFCPQETFRVTTECGNPSGCRMTSRVKVKL